jgi:hypothetical protein
MSEEAPDGVLFGSWGARRALTFSTGAAMITGVNRIFEHGGKQYHIQGDDLGTNEACFEVRVYDGGTVLWRKKVPYREVLEKNLPKADQEESLRALLEKTVLAVQAGIAKGKLA